MQDTVRIFVGCDPNGADAESQAVLEWSIRKFSSLPVEITWMKLSRDPTSPYYSDPETGTGWNTRQWATPFSGFRWSIPEVCNFNGRAIYMDSDIIVLADIAKLWRQNINPGKCVLAKGASASWRYCVSLWDCMAAKKHMRQPLELWKRNPDFHNQQVTYFKNHPELVQPFIGNWNCLDGETYEYLGNLVDEHPDIKAIHYTSMAHQPQLKYAIPRLAKNNQKHWFDGQVQRHWREDLIAMFDKLLDEAINEGYGPQRYLQEPPYGEVKKKSVSNSGTSGIPAWGKRQ